LPLIIAVSIATLIARSIEPRSIYDARLTDEEIEKRRKLRDEQMAPMTKGADQHGHG
jgi:H+/Cl- antiporter ClcA